MKKMIFLSLFTLLSNQITFAATNKIDMNVELIRNGDLSQFKIHAQTNGSTSVINTKYYMEVTSEIFIHEKSNIKTTFNIYEIKGKEKRVLVSPQFVLADGVLATFVTEDISTKDTIQIKIIPHMLS